MAMTSAVGMAGILASGRVLIVEDDVDFSESLVDLLDPARFQVKTATCGTKALALLDAFDPDLALIDVRLGHDNGVEVMAKLREKRPRLLCILMTAYAAIDSAVLAVRHGAHDYLRKPIDPEGLKHLVERSVLRVRRSEADQRNERMATLGQLAAGLAHDMNNMLAAIVTEAENAESMVGAANREGDLRAQLKTIQLAGVRAGDLTRQLLVFTRGKLPITPCDSPNEVLKHVAALVRGGLPPGVTLELDLRATSDAIVLDASQLQQVVMNLLINARDAIKPPGTLQLQSRNDLHPHDPQHGMGFVVTVVDTGIGIPLEVQDHIFEPFFTANTSGTGTGLGLSTVYGLVHAAKGEIAVNSQVGVGTRFDVWIPKAPDSAKAGPLSKTPVSVSPPASLTILLCDDDAGVLSSLVRLLERSGHVVISTSSVAATLEQWNIHRDRIDLVMTDFRIGSERGTAIVNAIHAVNPKLPILLMSGDIGELISLAHPDAALFRLQKPFTFEELSAVLSMSRP